MKIKTSGFEARRVMLALFVLTVAPPVVWGVASAAENGQDSERPAPSEETILSAGKNTEPMLLAASIARSKAEQSVTATAAQRQRTVQPAPLSEIQEGVSESAPELMAQAAATPATAAPGLETGSALVRPSTNEQSQDAEKPASTDEYYRPIQSEDEDAEEEGEDADLGGLVSTQPEQPAASAVDYDRLRVAPQGRRMRNAMHKVAASTAAALSSQNAFGSSFDPKRFDASPAGAAFERSLDSAADSVRVIPGVQLEGVTLSAGYSSNGIPGSQTLGFGNYVGSDYDMGASATFAYRNVGRSSNFTVRYTPQHVRRARLSEWNTTNHNLNISTSKELGRRWTVGGNVGANDTGIERFLIEAPEYHYLENAPASFDELVQQVQAGQLTDDEFAAALTGSPIIDKPAQRNLNLGRAIAVTASGHLSYAYSPRLTFTLNASHQRYRLYDDTAFRSRISENQTSSSNAFYFNQLGSSRAGVGARYRLSARQDVGFQQSVSYRGAVGPYGAQRSSSSEVVYSQKLARAWTYEVRGGMGSVSGTRRLLIDPADPTANLIDPIEVRGSNQTWVASGSLGYHVGQQRFTFSAGRRVGDALNFGNSAALNARLGWNWAPRRMPWSFNAAGSWFQNTFNGSALNGSRGFQSRMFNAGVNRILTPTTALNTSFQVGYFNTPYSGLFTNNSVTRVQVAFIWRPASRER